MKLTRKPKTVEAIQFKGTWTKEWRALEGLQIQPIKSGHKVEWVLVHGHMRLYPGDWLELPGTTGLYNVITKADAEKNYEAER